MKKAMFKCTITSIDTHAKTIYYCSSRKKLESFLNGSKFDGFAKTEITKSGKYYCTDGNDEIWTGK